MTSTKTSLPKLPDQVEVIPLPNSRDVFTSRTYPARFGQLIPIAYGGCTAGLSVSAALHTVDLTRFHLYSMLGHFLGPCRVDRHVKCTVTRTRSTKAFQTRRVTLSQTLDDGTERNCMEIICDFHVREPALLEYNPIPTLTPGPPGSGLDIFELIKNLSKTGDVSPLAFEMAQRFFEASHALVDWRHHPDGVDGQNAFGFMKDVKTTQHGRRMADKTSGEWLRTKDGVPLAPSSTVTTTNDTSHKPPQHTRDQEQKQQQHQTPESYASNAASLAFLMDGGLSMLPNHHAGIGADEPSAYSTLDFSLRVFTPDVDLSKWHFRERKGPQAGGGRTYSESKLWDEHGRLVALESQTCILRPGKGHDRVIKL